MTSSVASDELQVCTFVVGDLLLGLPLADVAEVVLGQDLTPVPLAPAAVLGLFNLRGRIVTAVDARARLGLPPRDRGEAQVHIVVRLRWDMISLVVDRTSDVVTLAAADAEGVPETAPTEIQRLLTASYQQPQGLLLVLDPTLALSAG
jgi:purine-binding chemotaxis protein CheW